MEEMEKKQDMERLREELNHWLAEEESDDDWKWLERREDICLRFSQLSSPPFFISYHPDLEALQVC